MVIGPYLIGQLGRSGLSLRRRVLRSHVTRDQNGVAQLLRIYWYVFAIADDLPYIR